MIAEDDAVLAGALLHMLENAGYSVEVFASGESAEAVLKREHFDLLLLDIGLPDLNGLELLQRLRSRGERIAVMLLTARDGITDRVRGFDLGADDYLVKPIAMLELLARVRAVLRRSRRFGDELNHGMLKMDLAAQRSWLGEEPLDLSAREWAVLEHLLKNVDCVVSKQKIVESLVSSQVELTSNAVEVYVSRLRDKIEPAGVHIRTVRGFGYMIESPATPAAWKD